jgi:hypothetical protein
MGTKISMRWCVKDMMVVSVWMKEPEGAILVMVAGRSCKVKEEGPLV